MDSPTLLTAEEAALAAGVTMKAFWRGMRLGLLPNPVRDSMPPRWRRDAVVLEAEMMRAVQDTRAAERKAARHARRLAKSGPPPGGAPFGRNLAA